MNIYREGKTERERHTERDKNTERDRVKERKRLNWPWNIKVRNTDKKYEIYDASQRENLINF